MNIAWKIADKSGQAIRQLKNKLSSDEINERLKNSKSNEPPYSLTMLNNNTNTNDMKKIIVVR